MPYFLYFIEVFSFVVVQQGENTVNGAWGPSESEITVCVLVLECIITF